MNHQQVHRSYATNGGVGRRGRNESSRSDVQSWRAPAAGGATRPSSSLTHHTASSSPSPSPTSSGRPFVEEEDGAHVVPGGRAGAAREKLLYLTMCLVGQYVDVQVKNGHVYTGIFHTADAEKDFGVVLKMARLTKDGSVKGGKSDAVKEAAKKPPLKTFIIHARDFVQIIAKDAHLTGDILPNGRAKDNKHELATDSAISQGRRDMERELKPWRPDHEAPKNLGLESTFQNSWNRNWDQFETNKTLFGVETTFDEELYTTKLDRGPQTKELEKEASRIAREIEGETTKNIHLAEERGTAHSQYDNMDEESKYSSVLHHGQDDVGEDNADGDEKDADHCNDETFGSGTGSVTESNENTPTPSEAGGHVVAGQLSSAGTETQLPPLLESALQVQALNLNTSSLKEAQRDSRGPKDSVKKVKQRDDQTKDLKAFSESMNDRTVKDYDGRLPKASSVAGKLHLPDDVRAGDKGTSNLTSLPSIAAPPASALPIPVTLSSTAGTGFSRNVGNAPEATVVDAGGSPSVGSTATSVKKSQLNPNAKEFKLNPNAKVFTPGSFTQRAASPISPQQSPVYMHPTINPVVPVGLSQYVQPPAQPAQITQFNTSLASAVTAAPYVQPSAAFVPAVPPQAATIKIPQSQPQVAYTQQQTFRYLPPMQAAPYPHHNGQLYPQQVIYGQSPVVYVAQQFPQGMMQGQPVPLAQQGPMPPPSPPTQTPR